ncbi:pyridine nucleotide-disulfide oxidoreductase [Rhodococcus sp. Leaf7]|uniref:NAD(P)/FAD-dependent oxidoreductase n=1 Tax=unclassified Rhodococcus (in: high G+C Gram-positive bacteria) TaxID=192944 RepID=UPI0005ABC1A2|nr:MULTISPECIES: FAD/NAD(P)-binding oxidoreductase [unclassified Rhodococcus (in: high G+C Gram-positive bacteria)]KIQ18313.1 pyridine nucleotide-disulfide oxidoreductase [Rhodococcus sp. MEB064]KQU04097.1 pyridine nucleotide-disulfide oxidoreductase [Rhodococcus sp. Leaf7]KQU40282.1 pyridine nucleotide-disulfide oxidoreductase [Rhodococcus sp. Leaf247]
MTPQRDIVVIGGGNAGISAAARFLNKGIDDVTVIEPQTVHTYRPLLSYVGGGQASLRSAQRSQRSVTPKGCRWIQDSVVSIDPVNRTVRCASGTEVGYRDLVLGPGLVPDHDALPGIDAALATASVASNYLDEATRTWHLVQTMPADGHAVFTVPRAPVSCTGTTLKPLFLAAAHWQKTGRSPSITLVVDRRGLVDVPALDERLEVRLRELDVRVLHDTAVTALDPGDRSLTVTGPAGAESISYDMLHLVPPYRGPKWLENCGPDFTAAHGLVNIDSRTFRHRVHDSVWAVGDGAAIDTDPSGGGLRQQVSIMVDNVLASRNGGTFGEYDGYTVAPIPVRARSLIAAEFDRTGEVTSSLPSFLDPLKPRLLSWAGDRYGLPVAYWNLLLKGHL